MEIYKTPNFNHAADTGKSGTGSWMTAAALVAVLATFAVSEVQAQAIIDEQFNDALAEDPSSTANWDTIAGELRLPATINSLTGSYLDGADLSTLIDAGNEEETRSADVGDMDGDGDLDIVFGNDGNNTIYYNDGFGVFVRDTIPDGFGNTRSAAIADLNGDGYLDVAFAVFGTGLASRVHFNNGSGSFAQGDFVDLGDITLKGDSIAAGDVDNDGDIDLVLGIDGGYVKLFRNDGFANFAAAEDIVDNASAFQFHVRTVLLGDLDGDGDLDLVSVRKDAPTSIHLNDGNGNFGLPQTAGGNIENRLPAPDSAALGDVNGDGLLDLFVGNDGEGSVLGSSAPNFLFLNSGGATIFPNAPITFADGFNTNGVEILDVDRDGDLDIVTADFVKGNGSNTPGINQLYLNDGAGNFPLNGTDITAVPTVSKTVASGDFDGDGDLDLVFGNEGDRVPIADDNAPNLLVFNAGTDSGLPANQLFATGLSIAFATGNDLSLGGFLDPSTSAASSDKEAQRVFQYWFSNDGGNSWVIAQPGRSFAFPTNASSLRWRVELNSRSPALSPTLGRLLVRTNVVPTITSTAVTAATQDVLYEYTITTADSQGDLLNVRDGATLPAWLTLTNNGDGTALLSGTPLNADVPGPNSVTLEVVDGAGQVGTPQTFTIDVLDANDPPTVPSPTGDQTFVQGTAVNLDTSAAFADPDLDVLTYSAAGLPTSLTLDTVTGIVTGEPTNDDFLASPHSVTITADDGNGGTVDDIFEITVDNINDAPTFISAAITDAAVAELYVYSVVAEDIDGDNVTITGGGLAWLTLTDNGDGTADLSGTPAETDVGDLVVTLNVSDGTLAGEQTFTITVAALPDTTAPVITLSGGAVTLTVGDSYTDAGATATDDVDGDITANIVTDNPVDTGTAGTYTVTYNVMDAAGNAAAEVTRTVTVNAAVVTPPPPTRNSGGGGGSASLLGLVLLAGLAGSRRRKKRLDS